MVATAAAENWREESFDGSGDLFAELYDSCLKPLIRKLEGDPVAMEELRLTEDEVLPLLHVEGAADEFLRALRTRYASHDDVTGAGSNDLRCISLNIEEQEHDAGGGSGSGSRSAGSTIESRRALAEASSGLGRALGSLPSLRTLKVRVYPSSGPAASSLWSSYSSATDKIGAAVVAAALQGAARTVESLDVTFVPSVDMEASELETGRIVVDSLLSAGRPPPLKSLSVMTCYERTANHFCTALLPNLPHLEEVSILSKHIYQSRYLSDEAYRGLFFHDSIKRIALDQVSMTETGIRIIGEALQGETCISTVVQLKLMDCSFPSEGSGGSVMADAIGSSTTFESLLFQSCHIDDSFFASLGVCLSDNRSLRELSFRGCAVKDTAMRHFETVFRGLAVNTTLRSLVFPSCRWWLVPPDVIRDSLAANTGLRKLEIGGMVGDDVWSTIFPFLRSNRNLRELTVRSSAMTGRSCLAAAEALAGNTYLVRAVIRGTGIKTTADAAELDGQGLYSASVRALGRNMTLESFIVEPTTPTFSCRFDEASGAALVSAARENYGLSNLFNGARWKPRFDVPDQKTLLDSIMRLNAAGRRYLSDPASRQRGVEVLIRVQDDLNCLFLHLTENASLCSRFS